MMQENIRIVVVATTNVMMIMSGRDLGSVLLSLQNLCTSI